MCCSTEMEQSRLHVRLIFLRWQNESRSKIALHTHIDRHIKCYITFRRVLCALIRINDIVYFNSMIAQQIAILHNHQHSTHIHIHVDIINTIEKRLRVRQKIVEEHSHCRIKSTNHPSDPSSRILYELTFCAFAFNETRLFLLPHSMIEMQRKRIM